MNEHALPAHGTGAAAKPAAAGNISHRYWAFISYSHADSAQAERLHKQLETYRTPKLLVGREHPFGAIPARLTPIFRDRQELAASSDLGREIKGALADSRYLIVICSPAAATSRWVDQEIRDFKRLHGEERMLAAIVGGEPFAADPRHECFPPSLRQKIDKRGKQTGKPAEPIASDFRESGDGWKLGTLKIIAGMLDVGLDDLVQRDQQRRQKRMTWIAAASLAGMAFTSGMSVFAISARDAARDERRSAEGLVGFMLGDLKEELEPIGRLSALDQVGTRALAYYERQDKKKLTDDQLAQRSRALTLLGQIAEKKGDSDAAETRYSEAIRSTEELVLRAPDNPQRLFDHSQNVFYLGEMARGRGQMEKAERAYREYQRLANRMVAIEPSNPRWQMEKFYATENIGIVLLNQRRFADAAIQFESAFRPMMAMASASPNNSSYQAELSNVYAWLADARRDEGRLQEARVLREQQIAFLTNIKASGNRDVELSRQLVWAQQALGILLTWQGQMVASVTRLRSAVSTADSLIRIEPENAEWRSAAAGARLELARTLISLGQIKEAAAETNIGCALISDLRSLDSKGASWRSFQTSCLQNRSRLARADGAMSVALALAEQTLQSSLSEKSADPVKDRYSVAAAYRLVGDVLRRMGERQSSHDAWTTGLKQLPTNVPERPSEIYERAALLERLGKNDEAQALKQKLRSIGFRKSWN